MSARIKRPRSYVVPIGNPNLCWSLCFDT